MNKLKGLYFQIYRDEFQKWRWRLWLDDEIIATSHQGHNEYDQAQAEIWHIMDTHANTPILG